jgi:hypothetical protein
MAKKKSNLNELLMNSAKAFGGGIGAEIVSDFLAGENAPQFVQDNPKITELAPAALGVAGLFFELGGKEMAPLYYGMIGAAGAGMADDLGIMSGFNRLNMNGTDAEEYEAGREYMEDLANEAFNEGGSSTMEGYDGTSYTGMGY